MDEFDKQWHDYTTESNFFLHYVSDYKYRHGLPLMQSWFKGTLRSQFGRSSDCDDIILLDYWTVEMEDGTDFIVKNHNVPFHAIIKTPVMEYWYAHANVNDQMLAYTGKSRRISLFDGHLASQPYYDSDLVRSGLTNDAFINCNKKTDFIPEVQTILTDCDRLAEEVF